jgi:hypothetical protein
MNNRHLAILSAFLLIVIASISCIHSFRTVSPLKFEPDTLPASQMSAPYETEIRITQNNTPVIDFSISKGALPAGLELVKVEGEDAAKISGIPEETGTFTFTISVWCYGTSVNGQTGEKEYSIVVEK